MNVVLIPTIILTMLLAAPGALAQWKIQDAHVTADLRGINSVGGGVAWASGSHGTVLRTEDMGHTWQLCATPPDAKELDFRGVQAFDNSTAIVMSSGPGDKSRLYKTTDGCQTWKLVFTNPDKAGFWDALRFENRQVGWLLGDPVAGQFVLYVTDDSGLHWTKQRNKGLATRSSDFGAFAASNSALVSRKGMPVFGTGGRGGAMIFQLSEKVVCLDECPPADQNLDGRQDKWLRLPVPVGTRTESSGVFSVALWTKRPDLLKMNYFVDPFYVAVGGDYLKPDDIKGTAATSDGSDKPWTPAAQPPHGYRSSVVYDEKAKTWITVGPNGTDISTDDGRNWRALKPGPGDAPDADKKWNALSLPFVVGPKGRIGILRDAALGARGVQSSGN